MLSLAVGRMPGEELKGAEMRMELGGGRGGVSGETTSLPLSDRQPRQSAKDADSALDNWQTAANTQTSSLTHSASFSDSNF